MGAQALTASKFVSALGVGALTGAGLVVAGEIALFFAGLVAEIAAGHTAGIAAAVKSLISVGAISFAYALACYAVGLAVVAAPAWLLLHICRVRTWPAAAALGAILNGGAVAILFRSNLWTPPLTLVALFSASGAIVGVVIWRAAYGTRNGVGAPE